MSKPIRAVVRPGYCRWALSDPVAEAMTRAPATWKSIDQPWTLVYVDSNLAEPVLDGSTTWLPEIPADAELVQLVPVPVL